MDWLNFMPNLFSCLWHRLWLWDLAQSRFPDASPRVTRPLNLSFLNCTNVNSNFCLLGILKDHCEHASYSFGERLVNIWAPQGTWCQIIHIWPVPGWVSDAVEPLCCGLLKCRNHLSNSLSIERGKKQLFKGGETARQNSKVLSPAICFQEHFGPSIV